MTTTDSQQPDQLGARPEYYFRPDELIVMISTDRPVSTSEIDRLQQQTRDTLESLLSATSILRDEETINFAAANNPGESRATFNAPDPTQPSLHFFYHRLPANASGYGNPENPAPWETLKSAVDLINARRQTVAHAVRGTLEPSVTVEVAMPSWFAAAQIGFGGGSPGSKPKLIARSDVEGHAWQYTPRKPFDYRLEAQKLDGQIPVVVLDTAPDWNRAVEAANRYRETANNHQLGELLGWLEQSAAAGTIPTSSDPPIGALSQAQQDRLDELDRYVRLTWGASEHRIEDHGLFVAGLIHDAAPRAPLRLVRVLSSYGVGDLPLLLTAMSTILAQKKLDDPIITNLSLGFLPPHEILPAIWRNTQGTPAKPIGRVDPTIVRFIELLDAAAAELMNVLRRNNVLVVAAAGNDSAPAVEAHAPRWLTRVPARYDAVLSVSATTGPAEGGAAPPALYANLGDLVMDTNGIATLGGDAYANYDVRNGVVGVFTAGSDPDNSENETGWAWWSGTSFATPIVSGIAANYWAVERAKPRDLDADGVHGELTSNAQGTGSDAPALAVPAVDVDGDWLR